MAGQYRFKDSNGNIVAQISASVEGAIAFSGSVVDFTQANNVILGNVQLAGTASNALLLDGFDSQAFAFTSSIHPFTASTNTRLDSIETISASNISRLNSLEEKTGSLATTGSNTFYGTQTFSGSLYVQDNLIVQGSSSLQNITASAVSIGTNIVYLNTDTPAVRFAGLTVQDSGSSAGVTGSMLWDSLCNRWIYSNPSTIGYSGGMLLSGPRAANLGEETTLTCNYIAKSGGGDHLYNSSIEETGTTTCFYGTSYIKSNGGAYYSGSVGIGTETPVARLEIFGTGNTLRLDSVANGSKTILLRNVGTCTSEIKTDGNLDFNIEDAGRTMRFLTSNTERLSITSDGNLILGKTNYDPKFYMTSTGGNGINERFYIDGYAHGGGSAYGGGFRLHTRDTVNVFHQRLTIDSGGNVGIGTTSPSEIFQVNKNNAGNIVGAYLTNSQANTGTESVSIAFGLNRSGGDFVRQVKAITFGAEQQWTGTESTVDGYLSFSTVLNETVGEKMRITSGGLVAIGNTNPSANGASAVLDIGNGSGGTLNLRDTNTGIASEGFHQIYGGDNRMYFYAGGSGASAYMQFYTNDAERMRITSSGVACFSNTICAPSLRVTGDTTISGTSGNINYFPNNPKANALCTTLLGSMVSCDLGYGPQFRFSGATSGEFIDIGQDKNGGFVVEGTDNPRLTVTNCGTVIIGATTTNKGLLRVAGNAEICKTLFFNCGEGTGGAFINTGAALACTTPAYDLRTMFGFNNQNNYGAYLFIHTGYNTVTTKNSTITGIVNNGANQTISILATTLDSGATAPSAHTSNWCIAFCWPNPANSNTTFISLAG